MPNHREEPHTRLTIPAQLILGGFMKFSRTQLGRAFAAAGLLTLAACGGGGGGGSSGSSATTVSGVAATGAAFGGATVTITDANGVATNCGSTNTSTGAYSCSLPSTAVAPFVLRALLTETGVALFSVLPEKKDSTANITPLTHAIAAALSPTGDPSALASEIQGNTATVTPSTVNAQVTVLQSGLTNVLTAASVTNFDPIGGSLTAGSGSGMDKVLDTVKVAVAPKSDTTGGGTQAGTVTITLRADPDTSLTITNGSSSVTPITSSAVSAVSTVSSINQTDAITELLSKMNTCYALPVGTRVDNQTGAATAANVTATACQEIFHTSVATFKSGGNVVGAKGAFKSLFSSAATGATFDRANLEYVVNNSGAANHGVWVVSYRVTLADGTVNYDTFGLKLDSNNKLRQYGNQYDYDTSVRAFVQDREFVNSTSSNYLSTGYVLNITNKVDGSGNSLFNKVVVTSPGNRVFTLKPTSGMSYLGLVNSVPTTLGTNFVRMGYAPTDSTATAWATSTDVSGTEENRLFFAPTKWTDADIAGIPNQGTWTFDIYLAGNNSSTPDVIQKARTVSRAPTIAELRKLKFAALTASQRTEITSNTSTTHWYVMNGTGIAEITDGSGNNAWTVPDGALPPTKATVYGNAPQTGGNWGNSFNDFTTFLGTTRKTSISCSRQSNADAHCVNTVAVGSSGNYANGTRITELQLNASSPLIDTSKHIAFYLP